MRKDKNDGESLFIEGNLNNDVEQELAKYVNVEIPLENKLKPIYKKKKKKKNKKRKVVPEQLDKEGEENMSFRQYSTQQLTDDIMTREAGATCYGYGTGASHERIIQSAGGEIGYDGFRDPRPGHDGPIYADREFINQETNKVQGINFRDAKGDFCCSYVGYDYNQIKEYNKDKKQKKREDELAASQKVEQEGEVDKYGVTVNNDQNSRTHGNNGYSGGVRR